jgi:hypothetical protein
MKTLPKIASVLFCLCSVTLVLHAQVPQIINYQGRVLSGSTNFDGSGQFKFALVNSNGTTAYWSNDGSLSLAPGAITPSSQPTAAVSLTVSKGLYSVLLGDTSIANMTVALPSSAFTNSDVRLRVWFNDGTHGSQLLTPDQRIAAVGYTFMADNIKDGAITMPKLANNAVGTSNIAIGAVGSNQLASGLTLAGTTSISGAINIPATTSATNGVIQMAGTPIISGFGFANVFFGANAGNFTLTGFQNTAVGTQAMQAMTTGSFNTATGTSALLTNTTGDNNTATGNHALAANTDGHTNTATGSSALLTNTTGSNNTATGSDSLRNNTGSYNTATGTSALFTNTTGSFNTATGESALRANNTGANNTAVGLLALVNNNGNDNIAIGKAAGQNITSGSNNIDIGNVGAAESNTIRIGTAGTHTATYLAGTVNGTFSGNGSALTNLNASNITPAVARLAGGNNFTGIQTITGDFNVGKIQSNTLNSGSYIEFDDSSGSSPKGLIGADGNGFSGQNNQFTIGTWTNNPLAFYTNQARRMTIRNDGAVAIGSTVGGHGQLEIDVNGGLYTTSGATGFSHNQHSFLVDITNGNFGSAIYANGDVVTTNFFVANSDERIKNIIGRSDAARDLSTLLGIEITNYRYKDVIAHGDAPFKKVIAQQVEKVFPQAVTKQTGEVPDIYKLATIKDGWIALATDLKKGERVRLIADEAQGVFEVVEVRRGAFRTDFKSATGKVFVYGREVKDFRNVDYDAIAMLNVSATQEMQREIESLQTTLNWQQKRLGDLKKEEQAQLAALRSENATLREENTANAKRLATLETRDKEREARLTRLEISMPAAQPVANTIASSKAGGQ